MIYEASSRIEPDLTDKLIRNYYFAVKLKYKWHHKTGSVLAYFLNKSYLHELNLWSTTASHFILKFSWVFTFFVLRKASHFSFSVLRPGKTLESLSLMPEWRRYRSTADARGELRRRGVKGRRETQQREGWGERITPMTDWQVLLLNEDNYITFGPLRVLICSGRTERGKKRGVQFNSLRVKSCSGKKQCEERWSCDRNWPTCAKSKK